MAKIVSVVSLLQCSIFFKHVECFYLFQYKLSSLNEFSDLLRVSFTTALDECSLCPVSKNSVTLRPLQTHIQHLMENNITQVTIIWVYCMQGLFFFWGGGGGGGGGGVGRLPPPPNTHTKLTFYALGIVYAPSWNLLLCTPHLLSKFLKHTLHMHIHNYTCTVIEW